ncbi:MAG: glycosyltransferase family 4 protein, partial [Syntrophomonadaceae bacterium]|nr:glycosyltransferase family 4 protein [Syntrophomonadaceae bacterium]
MRVLMLSWEYPPHQVGGLGQHVFELSRALVRQGLEVHVLTLAGEGNRTLEQNFGVNVHRIAPYQLSTPDFVTWILQINIALLEKAIALLPELGPFDLVHGHDWLVAHASRALKHSLRVPLIATIHATEYGRNNGLHNDTQRYISSVEWFLTYEAWRVIICSLYMRDELLRVFKLPEDKLCLIPNGVNLSDFEVDPGLEKEIERFRANYAHPSEKVVFCISRLVHEKGVQLLIDAAPKILAAYPQTKFIIAGRGPSEWYLKEKVRTLGLDNRFYFTGYIDEQTRNRLYRCADVAVCPSLYEPFGLVALEAMAAGTPVVVSDTGGISELVDNGVDGLKFNTGSSDSLARKVLEMLNHPQKSMHLREQARQKVINRYSWDVVAARTVIVYQQVLQESYCSSWSREP